MNTQTQNPTGLLDLSLSLLPNQQATKPAEETGPFRQSNTVFTTGLWADESEAGRQWADCLAGRTAGGSFLAKLEATARLHGYPNSGDWSIRVANIGWFNGASGYLEKMPLSQVLELVGDHEATGRALLQAVLQVTDVAGSEQDALADQRVMLGRVFENEAGLGCLSFENRLGASVVAGWLAAEGEHLVTHRAFDGKLLNGELTFLSTQLERCGIGWRGFKFDEALARTFAATYGANQQQERLAICEAVESSLAAARDKNWGACGFLLDGIQRGRDLVLVDPVRTVNILHELGDSLGEMLRIFELQFDAGVGKASNADGWHELTQKWLQYSSPKMLAATDRGQALLTLCRAYDAMFWFGLLREAASWTNSQEEAGQN